MKKGNAVFAFILKNKEGQTDSWYIDLKEKGKVAKGEAPSGKQSDGQVLIIPKQCTRICCLERTAEI